MAASSKCSVASVVANIVEAHASLSKMSCGQRLAFGEALAAALRQSGALEKYSVTTRPYQQECDIEAGPLKIQIDASQEVGDADIPY